ncbi:MAG: hypothetical protein AABX94_02455 [Nanoarchaeota archaeon]
MVSFNLFSVVSGVSEKEIGIAHISLNIEINQWLEEHPDIRVLDSKYGLQDYKHRELSKDPGEVLEGRQDYLHVIHVFYEHKT